MQVRAALVSLLMCLVAPVCADALLWDNGAPDWRYAIPAPTDPEDAEPSPAILSPGFCDRADEFENDAPWKVSAISLQGAFGLVSDQDPDQKSNRIEVKIHRSDAEGLPGELFWSTKLQGEAAWDAQTFGDEVRVSHDTFSDIDNGPGTTGPLATLVEIDVRNPDGLVTLPPGKWFVSWRVESIERTPAHHGARSAFAFLSAAYPRPGSEGDQPFCGSSMVYWALKEAGDSILMWVCPGKSNRPAPSPDMKYNLSFKIYGEKQ
jgi:hypothetical protein